MTASAKTVFSKIIIAFCLLTGFLLYVRQCNITYRESVSFGGTDLRVRIVGSRWLVVDSNAYTARWKNGLPETFCDPNDDFTRPVNGVTVTPFLLCLQQPLAKLAYPQIRIFWWWAQQLLLLFIIGYFIWFYKRCWPAICAMVLAAGLLINSPFWFFHSERGQMYILCSAWMTILFALWHRRGKAWLIFTGFWMAAGILLRPPLGIFLLVSFFLLSNKERILLAVSCGLFTAMLMLICGGLQLWQQYFSAMGVYVEMALHNLSFAPGVKPAMPASIEGASNLRLYKDDYSIIYITSLHNYFGTRGWQPGSGIYVAIFLVIATLLTIPFLLMHKKHKALPTQFFMWAILLYTVAEVCQPLRGAYNLIQWLPALLAAVGFMFAGPRKPR